MTSIDKRLTLVTDTLALVWAFLERWGWPVLGVAIVIYAFGGTALEASINCLKRATYNRAAAEERESRYEEERLRRIEEMQARVRLAAEAAEKKKAEASPLKPRAEMPGKDDKPSSRREYNPLTGDSSRSSKIQSTMRQRRGGGG